MLDNYTYDAWGNMVDKSGSTLHPFKYIGKYGYYAHFQDDNVMPYLVNPGMIGGSCSLSGSVLSFIQTGVRTYFPRLGRYMQIDPIKDGINFLAYSDNNPVNYIDPNGKRSIPQWLLDWLTTNSIFFYHYFKKLMGQIIICQANIILLFGIILQWSVQKTFYEHKLALMPVKT